MGFRKGGAWGRLLEEIYIILKENRREVVLSQKNPIIIDPNLTQIMQNKPDTLC